jgi:hypothetical protein
MFGGLVFVIWLWNKRLMSHGREKGKPEKA